MTTRLVHTGSVVLTIGFLFATCLSPVRGADRLMDDEMALVTGGSCPGDQRCDFQIPGCGSVCMPLPGNPVYANKEARDIDYVVCRDKYWWEIGGSCSNNLTVMCARWLWFRTGCNTTPGLQGTCLTAAGCSGSTTCPTWPF